MYPSNYMCFNNDVKSVHQDFDFIYTDGSVWKNLGTALAVIDNSSSIERLLNKCFIF